MKKFMSLLFFFMLIPVAIFAQEPEIPIPADLNDVMVRFNFWITAFAPLVGLTIMLSQSIISLFKIMGGAAKQIISWGLGAVLVVALNLFDLGIAKDLTWYGVAAYAVAVALAANRAFDVGLLESILKWFKLYKPRVL